MGGCGVGWLSVVGVAEMVVVGGLVGWCRWVSWLVSENGLIGLGFLVWFRIRVICKSV